MGGEAKLCWERIGGGGRGELGGRVSCCHSIEERLSIFHVLDIFLPFLSPYIPGVILDRRNTLHVMFWIETHKIAN